MTLDISNLSKHRSKIYLGTSVSVKFDVGAGALVPDSALDEACEHFSKINFDLCSSVEDLASRIAFCVNQDQIHANRISIDWVYGQHGTIAGVAVASLEHKVQRVVPRSTPPQSEYSPL